MLSNFTVDFLTQRPFLVILVALVLVALSIFVYLHTNPQLPRWLRGILATLRIAAILALVAVLLEPIIGYSRHFERSRKVAVLIDKSGSMERIEGNKTRGARLDSLLSSEVFERVTTTAEVTTFFFGEKLDPLAENITGDKTAIGDALAHVANLEIGEPFDYWLLFSDGNSNFGRPPASVTTGTPVIAIDMSQDAGLFDLYIDEVEYNPVVFVGRKSELRVRAGWRGVDSATAINAQVRDARRVLAETRQTVTQDAGFTELTLSYTPGQAGQLLLTIELPPQLREETPDNNSRTIAVRVLKSRLSVLLVTAAPDYEIGFLSRYLRGSDKYELNLLSTGDESGNLAGRLPASQSELNRYDLVILHDPHPAILTSRSGIIQSYLRERGGAIWIMLGATFATQETPEWLTRILPFSPTRRRPIEYVEFTGEPVESQLFHPAVRIADDRSTIRELWSTLPPFKALVRCGAAATDATILVNASLAGENGAPSPILGYRRSGPGKLATSAASPFWQWSFTQAGLGEDVSAYSRFIEGLISWLTVPEDSDPIRIVPEKEVFARGEVVAFDGFAFDQGFRPIPDATGVIQLSSDSLTTPLEVDLVSRGEGKFRAEFPSVPPGQYRYTGIFEKSGTELKRMSGRIAVEDFSLEEFDQSGDPAALAGIAQRSSGAYLHHNDFASLERVMNLERVQESEDREFGLLGNTWILLLFIVCLCAEWLIRKLNHLL